ncbi:MAG: phosphoribosylamine--glycine ligase [Myxococcota bacterium]|jgi:phosphoribosylamine--glycine ligase
MRCLVVGNGGREHALAAALARAASVSAVFVTRPNAGTARIAEAVDVAPTDVDGVVSAAQSLQIGLVVIGPEAPLVAGLADRLDALNIPVLGPTAAAAQLEGSKQFAKELMSEANIPTAAYGVFESSAEAIAFVRSQGRPMVVKADGLAAGKGVIVPETIQETEDAIRNILDGGAFGGAGARVVVEELMVGPEVSVIGLVHGETVRPFPASRDHKRALDGDLGPNTGGMGAFSPVPALDPSTYAATVQDVLGAAARAMSARGTPYRGFLYAGLMLTPDGPRVLEFNCRMGDPECQPLMQRLKSDAGVLFLAAATGKLAEADLRFNDQPSVCVVLASGGYPGRYPKGIAITGLKAAEEVEGVTVYHAGTRQAGEAVVTSGGRVLGVTAQGTTFQEAISRAYQAADHIQFEGKQLRRDIGASALR